MRHTPLPILRYTVTSLGDPTPPPQAELRAVPDVSSNDPVLAIENVVGGKRINMPCLRDGGVTQKHGDVQCMPSRVLAYFVAALPIKGDRDDSQFRLVACLS